MDMHAEVSAVLERLAATPRRIKKASQKYTDAQLSQAADGDTWSANEILAHLRANADVWGKSILAMIAQNHPTIRYVSPRGWMRKSGYTEQGFGESFNAYQGQRDALLKVLGELGADEWSRGATFTGTTKGREHTVLSYGQQIAEHEEQHCKQLEALLNRQGT
jgi:DinB superfamily